MQRLLPMLDDWLRIAIFAWPPVWILNRLGWKKGRKGCLGVLLLVAYLAMMYNIVGIPAYGDWHWNPRIAMQPFANIGSKWGQFQLRANALMFLPLGFFLPLLWKESRSFLRTVGTGFLLSLSIELMQLFSFRTTDVDDLSMNTLGAALGYLCFRLICGSASGRRGKNAEFWLTNLVVLLCVIFLRPLSYRLF